MQVSKKIVLVVLICSVLLSGCPAGRAVGPTIKVLQNIPWGKWIVLADAVVNLVMNIRQWIGNSESEGKISAKGQKDGAIKGVPMLVRDQRTGKIREIVIKARWNADKQVWEIVDQ